jgi:hypothetical protein
MGTKAVMAVWLAAMPKYYASGTFMSDLNTN